MSISAINSVNFTGKTKVTKNGNEYEKTNACKYAGMGSGLLAGGAYGYLTANKVMKSFSAKKAVFASMSETYKAFSGKETLKAALEEVGMTAKEFKQIVAKSIKGGVISAGVMAGVAACLITSCVGFIADSVINRSRAKQADKAAEKAEA